MLTHATNKIKSWLEKWQHRLKGHILITILHDDGEVTEFWAKDIFSHDSELWLVADLIDGSFYNLFPTDDITITGA